MKNLKKKLNNLMCLLIVLCAFLLSGCFTYVAKADTIEVDETSIPKEVTIADFNLSDIKLIVHKIDGTDEIISVTRDMLSDQALEKLTKSGTHYVYIRYNGKLALATITLLDKYPSVLINFDSNGGSSVKRQVIEKNSLALKPTDPVKNGYKFTGWYTDEALTTPFKFSTKVDKNIVLYAGWEAIQNIIKYETNGGNEISDGVFVTGEMHVLPSDPVKEGYTFKGWYTDSDFIAKYQEDIVSSSFTLYALWSANECTVVFEENGGSEIGDLVVLFDNKVVEPMAPSRYGYILEGWYTDREFTQRYDFDALVKGNLVLYANWKEAKYTVKFETNGGTLMDDIVLNHNEFLPPSSNPTKENFNFSGWYLDKELTTPFDQTVGVTSDLTLYAKWEGIVCKISFETNGGTVIDTINVNYGDNAEKPVSPSREGYIFAGWFLDSELTKTFNFGTVIREDYTLYAKWVFDATVKPKYTVTLYDGYFNVFKTFKVYEGELLEGLASPTMEGLAFEGWYLDQSFEFRYDLSIPVTIDLELYSNFVETYVVTFVSKDGSTIAVQEVLGGRDAYNIVAPTIEYYDFVGWSRSLKNVTESFTVHPIYELHKYKVTFMIGETVISTQYIPRGEEAQEPANLDEHATTGYHFAGWDKAVLPIYSDTVYVARFEKNEYKVEFVDYFGKVYETVKLKHGDKITRPNFDGDSYVQVMGWYTDNTFETRYQFNQEIHGNVLVYGRFDFVGTITYVTNGNEITITNLNLRNIVNAEIPNYLNDKVVTKVEKLTNTDKVKTITIRSNLTSIDISELSNISTLEAINVNSNGVYSSNNGILYKGTTLVLYPASKKGASVTITSSEVGEYAFRNNKYVVRLSLPNVTSIKDNAFSGSNITHIDLTLTATKLGSSFSDTNTSLVILVPSTKYGEYVANWNDLATNIYQTSQISGDYLIKEEASHVEIVEYLGDASKVTIPDMINSKNVTKIASFAFNSISSIKGITVGDNVTEICDNAFNGLELDYLIIRGSVTISNTYKASLKEMTKDTNVFIKDSEFDNYSFDHKYLLSLITGDYAFTNEGGKYGVLEYFGNETEVVIPDTYLTHPIEFVKKGFISSDVTKITLNNDLVIENGAIKDSVLLLVNSELVQKYKENYPTLRIYSKDLVIMDSGDYTIGVSEGEAVIIKINATESEIVIPNTLSGYPVTSIGKYALSENDKVRKITVGDSISFIDLYALRSKNQANTLEIIFLRNVAPSVNGDICYLTDKIYKNDESLREYGVRFPNHTVTIYNALVKETDDYRYLVTGKFVTILKYLGNSKEVSIPSFIDGYTVIRVASYAFIGKNVETITVPSSVLYLEYLAFGGASGLKEVILETTNVIELEDQLTNNSAVIRVSDEVVHRFKMNRNWQKEEILGFNSVIVTKDDIKYYVLDGEAVIIHIDEDMTRLTLNSEMDGYPITRLAPYAIYDTNVTTLTLSSSIKEIGYNSLPKELANLIIRNMEAPRLAKQSAKFKVTITDSYKITITSDYDELEVSGATERSGEEANFEYVILDGEATITKYNGTGDNAVIPQTIDSAPVRRLGANAFRNNTTLKEITIPSNVRTIGDNAFNGCTNLDTINLNGGITSIGIDAFKNTKYINLNTEKLIIIDKVLYMYQEFYDTSGAVSIETNIVSIAPYAFYQSTKLTSIALPGSVTNIGQYAFTSCVNLTEVTLPNSVRVIDSYAFSDCTRLRKVTFGTRLEEISSYAFSGCTNLSDMNLIELTALEEIGSNAFEACTSLLTVTIPGSVTKLGHNIFNLCGNLDEVETNSASFMIINGVLYNKDKTIVIEDLLKSNARVISLEKTVQKISENAFNGSNTKKIIVNSNALLLGGAIKNNAKLEALVFMGSEVPLVSKESLDVDCPIYILNTLLSRVKGDEVLSKHIVRGVISYSFDTYTIQVGSIFNIKPVIPIDVNSSDVSYRSLNEDILALVDGKFEAKGVGTVKFVAYLSLDEVQSVEITINVVK